MKTNSQINDSGLKNRSEQLCTRTRAKINFARRMANRSLNTADLLNLLRNHTPRFYELAEVVGQWVWIQFDAKQPSEVTGTLAELGFHWNGSRQAWQHPCGVPRDVAASVDPRQKYGSYFAADSQAA